MSTTPRARLPRTLAALASHPWVDWIDDGRDTGDNIHVYLRPGFVWAGTTSAVIEPTVREACQAFREVAWDPAAWGEACGASPAEVAALTGEAAPAPAAPASRPVLPGEATPPPAPSHGEAAPTLQPLSSTQTETQITETLRQYHFTDEQIDFLMRIVRNNAQFEDGKDREFMQELANQIEDQIVNHPDNDTEYPCPVGGGDPARAEAVVEVRGGVAVICSGSPREAFRLPDTVSLCGAAAALEAGGWILSPALEALARRWRDISGEQEPSAEAVAIAEAAAPRLKRFEVFHRTWWRAEGVPGVGPSRFVAWASTEAHARHLCRRWNAAHLPGPLSDRAEYTAA